MSLETGRILSVDTRPIGDELAVAAPAGSTSLQVLDVSTFEEDEGSLRLGDEVLAYIATDDATNTLTLAAPTTADAAPGDPVEAWDLTAGDVAVETVAQVRVEGEDFDEDSLEATVHHTLVPLLKEGTRPGPTEWVILEYIDQDLYVMDLLNRRPKLNAEALDPDTVTAIPGVPDGLPPDYSPIPRLIPALGAIVVTFQQVPNHDPVSYDLYLSTDPTCPVVTANLAASGRGSTTFLREVPATLAPLELGKTYYVRTHAFDHDGYAPPSDPYEVVITANLDLLMGITETHVTDTVVQSPLFQGVVGQFVILQAGTITADEAFVEALNAVTFTGTLIQTHNDPLQGVKMSADLNGLVAYDGTQESVRIDAYTGQLTAIGAISTSFPGNARMEFRQVPGFDAGILRWFDDDDVIQSWVFGGNNDLWLNAAGTYGSSIILRGNLGVAEVGGDLTATTLTASGTVVGAWVHSTGDVYAAGTAAGSALYSYGPIDAEGTVTGLTVVGNNRVRSMGTLGAWGSLGPGSQPGTPANQADIIAVLQAYGLCA